MLPQEIIRRKRDGEALSEAEIAVFVRGLADGTLGEGQVAAFAMAVFFQGLSRVECSALTREMTRSGQTIAWSDLALDGPVLDKHSTGGVGDKVSLMLAPVVAACGGYVPMISGRGLGHTGGTLDKLEAIPGYDATPPLERFRRVVAEVGCAIIGQTGELAPADRRFYAVRDVTATVESVPLITASILSKKLAAGLQGLVMDVKTGSGAFARSRETARALAESLVAVAGAAGLPTAALITDMNQVLGRSAGNALEVAETLAYLDGSRREPRLHALVIETAAQMLVLGGLAGDLGDARRRAEAVLASGRAAETFARMVAALGGPRDFVDRAEAHLPRAPVTRACPPPAPGVVRAMDVRQVGLAVVALGGGRRQAADRVDPAVGLSEVAGIGEAVDGERPLAVVHARSEDAAAAAIRELQAAVEVGPAGADAGPVVVERIGEAAAGPGHRAGGG